MLETSISNNNVGFWASSSIVEGGKFGYTVLSSPSGDGIGNISGFQLNVGAGLPCGPFPIDFSGGVYNTTLLRFH